MAGALTEIKCLKFMLKVGIECEKNRQILYNFVLDQIKYKLMKKTSRLIYLQQL